jgi:hypothetical protein
MNHPTGLILWEGASLLDGAPIAVIATLHSDNVKTGDMIQTWIVRADVSPVDAVKSGADSSICGDCKHRGDGTGKGRTCYVTVFQAPLNIWKGYKAGRYPRLDRATHGELIAGRAVRLGSYGDPAAVPYMVWADLINLSGYGQWSGYTHQWRRGDQRLADYVMASVDTPEEREQAAAMGWRTFRVRLASEELAPREIVCPASAESKASDVTCSRCLACHGNAKGRRGSVAIIVHGAPSKVNAYQGLRAA